MHNLINHPQGPLVKENDWQATVEAIITTSKNIDPYPFHTEKSRELRIERSGGRSAEDCHHV